MVSITPTALPNSYHLATFEVASTKYTEFDTEKCSEDEDDIDLIVEKYGCESLAHLSSQERIELIKCLRDKGCNG